MKVTKKEIDALNASITISIEKSDYQPEVTKVLKNYRQKANIPGFRAGKVPMGMIKKMYGTSILVDEVNKIVSHELYNYVYTNKLDILGEPLPNEEQQKVVNWEKDEKFDFVFDIAVAPEFEVKLSKKDKIKFYDINPGDELIEKYVDGYKKQFGSHIEKDIVGEDDMLKGLMTDQKEEGISKADAVFLVNTLKTKKAQKVFVGKKKGETIEFKVREVFKNDVDLKSMLAIDDAQMENLSETFYFTIESISEFKNAELDQALFDKVFGEGTVKNEKEFKAKIVEQAKVNLSKDAEYKFHMDAKEKLTSKIKFELPDAFLKRWLIATNKEITQERLENEYPMFQEDMKWQLIKGKVVKDQDIKVEEEGLLASAMEYARAQFQMYGSVSIPDEYIQNFAKEMLEKKEERQKITEQYLENKIIGYIKETVKLDETEIDYDSFNKFFDQK